jgi:hypothetical protein
MMNSMVSQARNDTHPSGLIFVFKENFVGRVIHLQNGSTIRNQAMRQIVWIIREMTKSNIPETARKDMAAGIVLALRAIQDTIEQAATAWEKRDYWVKADHFRMDWRWVIKAEADLHSALVKEDWGACAGVAVFLAQKMSTIEMPKRIPAIPPWQDAWRRFLEKENRST